MVPCCACIIGVLIVHAWHLPKLGPYLIGTCCMLADLVNLLLASRFLPVKPKVSFLMAVLALTIYGGCLGINWTWQVAFVWRLLRTNPTVGLLIYVTVISAVVADDCILLAWLWRNAVRTADTVASEPASPLKGQKRE